MEIFKLTLSQMLMMFTLILVGYLLRKKANVPSNAGTVMAKIETFVLVPALSMFTLMSKCTVENFKNNFQLILYGFILVLAAIALSYPLSKLFTKKGDKSPEAIYQRNVYKYALTFGNFGFMGNFIALGIWGQEVFFKYILFTVFISVFCNSWGLYILIPKDQNSGILQNLKKGLLTPPIIAIVLGIIFGLLNMGEILPQFMLKAMENAGNCQGPIAMLLAGFVIGGYNFKEILLNKKVYLVTFFRLILIPAVIMVIMKLLGINKEIMTLALIAFSTPLGLNTIVFPAAYGGETKTGASMAMISHVLSVITIPLMYLVFIVLL